jgi:hypothetical protein
MSRPKSPIAVASLLDRCLDRIAGEPGAAAIWRVWSDAVGPQIARRAQPVRLRGRTLIVAVSSAPWMQELKLLAPAIRTALNDALGAPLVADLYLVLTDGDDVVAGGARTTPPARRCPRPPANPDLGALSDPLRESFREFLAAWQRRARA